MLVGVNAAVLGSAGPNRGGAVSVVQAMRFGGAALAPPGPDTDLRLFACRELPDPPHYCSPSSLPLIMPKQR